MVDKFILVQHMGLPVLFNCESDDSRWFITPFRLLAPYADKFVKFILDMAVFAVECASAILIGLRWHVVCFYWLNRCVADRTLSLSFVEERFVK